MIEQVQISVADIPNSSALEALIQKEVERLEHLFQRIVSIRVRIQQAYKRQGSPYSVRIEINVPHETLVVDDEPGPETEQSHRNAERAVRDAFRIAGRRVQEYARRLQAPRA
jgi:ribosome-associated translation inhibitor RaiA